MMQVILHRFVQYFRLGIKRMVQEVMGSVLGVALEQRFLRETAPVVGQLKLLNKCVLMSNNVFELVSCVWGKKKN